MIEKVAQVDIQDPPFQQRVQVEFHLFDSQVGKIAQSILLLAI